MADPRNEREAWAQLRATAARRAAESRRPRHEPAPLVFVPRSWIGRWLQAICRWF